MDTIKTMMFVKVSKICKLFLTNYKSFCPMKEGECYAQGTLEQETDGTCTCNPGYIRVRCDYCHPDYHRDGDQCKELDCNEDGTDKRYPDGTCECNFNFVGPRCDQCNSGYKGENCDLCTSEYHKEEDKCALGECDPEGTDTRTDRGACICKLGYGGYKCNRCDNGHFGASCEYCESGFTKHEGTCRGTKVLVATGDPWEDGRKVHVYDMKNSSWVCELQDFPISVRVAFGALVGNTPLICGGTNGWSAQDSCYVFEDHKWTKLLNMEKPRYNGASLGIVKDNQSMLLMGGFTLYSNFIHESEWIYLNGSSRMANDTNIPFGKNDDSGLILGCTVTVDENTFMHTGGGQYHWWSDWRQTWDIHATDATYYYDLETGERSIGPDMNKKRLSHACTRAIVGGQAIIFVAGGVDELISDEVFTKVEYLIPGKTFTWKYAKDLPRSNRYAHIVTSIDGKSSYLTGGQDHRGFLELVCNNDNYKNCEFVEIETEDKRPEGLFGIAGSVAMAVPELWVEDNCNH